MGFPLSWNIDGQDLRAWLKDNNYAGLRAHLLNLKPAAILIMDSLPIAVMVKGWLPECIVIHRNYSRHEGSEWLARPPHEMVGQWKREGHKEIVRYLTNEPGFHVGNAFTFSGREAETMKLAREAGFTVVALNTSVGTPEPQLIDDGWFDGLLIAAWQYRHYLGCHEYYTLCLPASLMGDEALLDKNALQPANWPREKITVDTPGVHYLFRSARFVKRCRKLGISDPRIIHTEFGYDDIRNSGNGHIFDALRAKYGLLQYNDDMRGVNTYQNAWDDIYPGVDHNQVIRQQLQWWLDVKPPWVIAACIYGINEDWSIPQGHDWSDNVRRSFLPVLEEMSKAMTEQPAPEITYDYKPRILDVKVDSLLIRSEMSRASNTLGKFTRGRIGVFVDMEHIQSIGSYSWIPILYKVKPAFVARHSLKDDGTVHDVYAAIVTETVEPPVEPPTPDPEPTPEQPLPFDEIAIGAIVNRVIDLRLENLRSHIDEGHIPRTLAITISRAMRVIAGMLDAAIAMEEVASQPTTAQVANVVNAEIDEEKGAKVVDVLTNNSATEPPG